jgi:hypothetical protein
LKRRGGLDEQNLMADLLTDVVQSNHASLEAQKEFSRRS